MGLAGDVLSRQKMMDVGLPLSSTVQCGQENKTLDQTEFISNT